MSTGELGTIEAMRRSHADRLGFDVSGDVARDDYDTLTPAVERTVEEYGGGDLDETHRRQGN